MINRATDISTVGGANDDRRRKIVVRPPAHCRELVAQLHVSGPDVVEELNLDDRLESTGRESNGASNDVRFGERRVVDATAAELLLEPPRHLEHATLSLDLAEVFLARYVGNVLSEDEDLLVAPHLVLHAGIEEIDHCRRLAGELRVVLSVELLAGRIHIRRVHAVVN